MFSRDRVQGQVMPCIGLQARPVSESAEVHSEPNAEQGLGLGLGLGLDRQLLVTTSLTLTLALTLALTPCGELGSSSSVCRGRSKRNNQ